MRRFKDYNKPQPLGKAAEDLFDPKNMVPGYKRGMVLKLYKAKLLELIGCKPKPFYLCEGIVPYSFQVERCRLDVDDCRLQTIDRSGLTDAKKNRRRSLLKDLADATLLPKDPDKSDYANPMLLIRCRPGSMWIHELQHRRYQLKMLINKRLKSEFLKQVKIK